MAEIFPTVLLIEDEALIRMGTAAMLEDAGYLVLEAANADEGRTVLADHAEIGIVVTDVQMPGSMDGLALADIIQNDYPKIRILVTSGRTERHEAREHGAVSFLSKPYTANAIQEAIRSFA